MNELRVFLHSGLDVVDSREVAQMVEKRHDNLIRDISGYIKIIEKNNAIRSEDVTKGNERNFAPSDFFIPSTYKDRKGEIRPCYLLTKKGCDMVANKMTGEKGVLFTAAYITAFEAMREHIFGKENAQPLNQETEQAKISFQRAELLNSIAMGYDGTYRQVLQAYAAKELTGKFILPLPRADRPTYTAQEIGNRLGISANKVGHLANKNGLKTEQYGAWFVDKSPYSNKEVRSFRYYEEVIPALQMVLGT